MDCPSCHISLLASGMRFLGDIMKKPVFNVLSDVEISNLWVGTFGFGPFVYDESIQTDQRTVIIFELEQNEMTKYIREELRPLTKREKNAAVVKEITAKYVKWRRFYSSKISSVEEKPAFSFHEYREQAMTNHREKMSNLHKPYQGTVKPQPKRAKRKTYCYSCKKPLNSDLDQECMTCKWMLCHCGACGCGFTQSATY